MYLWLFVSELTIRLSIIALAPCSTQVAWKKTHEIQRRRSRCPRVATCTLSDLLFVHVSAYRFYTVRYILIQTRRFGREISRWHGKPRTPGVPHRFPSLSRGRHSRATRTRIRVTRVNNNNIIFACTRIPPIPIYVTVYIEGGSERLCRYPRAFGSPSFSATRKTAFSAATFPTRDRN